MFDGVRRGRGRVTMVTVGGRGAFYLKVQGTAFGCLFK